MPRFIANDRSATKRSFATVRSVSPRRSALAAQATRSAVINETVNRASTDGLEGVSIGGLAQSLGMSKAGVIGPFGSKKTLQLAALERAIEIFRAEVWEPAAAAPPGLARLTAITDAWLNYLSRDVFPGGCFLTQSAAEFDGRPGPVKEAVVQALSLWEAVLASEAKVAVKAGQLPAIDPRQVAFELGAIAQGVNQALQLRGDERAVERGRLAMRRSLGVSP